MRKILDAIGVRLYALKHIPEYKMHCAITAGLFITSLLLVLDIFKTEVF